MQWMVGDWLSLTSLDRVALECHPERASLAAYVGAALQQMGELREAQVLLKQAKAWGCSHTLLAEVLLSGAHFTLARAALLAGDKSRALRNLRESIELGMPGENVMLIARARIDAQGQLPGGSLLDWGVVDQFELCTDQKHAPNQPATDVSVKACSNGSVNACAP